MARLQHPRGMHDILPADHPVWNLVEGVAARVLTAYGFQQIRPPLVEHVELFKRSVGDVTDIVQKEMYVFTDRGGEELALRPEGTAGVVRAGLEHGLLHNQRQRWWYVGPMFRYERPQKGRVRQHHQIGAEAFGFPGPEMDIELLCIVARMFRKLGIYEHCKLNLNSLGTVETRRSFRTALVDYLTPLRDQLDEDSQGRLIRNPLRILDSKDADVQRLLEHGPKLPDFLDAGGRAHFMAVCDGLRDLNISFVLNPRLVRGLDYYTHTVFEWVTDKLGAQATVCGGGRYDGLVEELGGSTTPGTGWSMGVERVVELVQLSQVKVDIPPILVYWVALGEKAVIRARHYSETLNDRSTESDRVLIQRSDNSQANLKTQLKRADQSGAQYAAIVGENELQRDAITLKPLRGQSEQRELAWDQALTTLIHWHEEMTKERIDDERFSERRRTS